VHSSLDHTGYTPALISFARAKGTSGYPGDGSNRWAATHTLDAAHLYRLAIESAPAGSRLHAVADEGVPLREIAEVIGRNLGVPAVSIAPEEIVDYFDFLAFFISLDNPASSTLTQELLDWHPTHPGLISTKATTSGTERDVRVHRPVSRVPPAHHDEGDAETDGGIGGEHQ